MWQIKYQNEFLDLQPGQSPEITRNSPLFLIDNILQESSTPFTLSYSDKNSRLLGHYFFEQTKKARMKIEVEVYHHHSYKFNATMVIESAGMNNAHVGNSYASGYLLFGISHFFSSIKDKLLSALSLGGQRVFNYTTSDPTDSSAGYWQHFNNIYDFSDDYVMAPYRNLAFTADDVEFQNSELWGNKYDGTKIAVDQPVIPFTKLSYVLQQIFAESGWTLDTSELNDTEWQKLILYSNCTISTTDFTWSGSAIVANPKSTITVDLAKAMPPNVTCSTFLFEICKRYLWAPVCDVSTNTCRLIALKDMASKPAKDWTKYASPDFTSEFTVDEKIFAFKNDYNDDDQLPSSPDFSLYPLIGFAKTKELLIDPTYLNENSLYYVWLENKWYKTVYDDVTHANTWQAYADNIYDVDPGDATDTFETLVTTLPITPVLVTAGSNGLFPLVNQAKNTVWQIRTLLYHGMVHFVDDGGTATTDTFPYASSTCMAPAQDVDPVLAWSNVFSHNDFLKEYGIKNYWAKKWMQIVGTVEEPTRDINLPFHELISFDWDQPVIIRNIPYLVKSFVQTLDQPDDICLIQAKLQPMNLVANPDDVIIVPTTDAHFDHVTLLSEDRYNWVGQAFLVGEPGATLTLKVILFNKSNPAFYFKVNNVAKVLNDTFTITLDGSGAANYNVKLGGVTIPGQGVQVQVQIIATDTGVIGTPDVQQYSKTTG